jgi:hypothetical protein
LEAFDKFFGASVPDAVHASLLSEILPREASGRLDDVIADAEALLKGEWSIFGRAIRLDDPPLWRHNPISGGEWPDLPASQIDYRRNDIAGGVKCVWEVGRLTFLPVLALAYRETKRAEFADACIRWMADFSARNPVHHGVHQTSGIEMAIRVMTCSVALSLLGERAADERLRPALGLLAQQAYHCRDNLSLGSSANNHLLAEAAAMVCAGAVFPNLKGLLDPGLDILRREVLLQISADGTSVEQSFQYVPFIWELILIPLLAARSIGVPIREEVSDRLRASLSWARVNRLPNGTLPQIGDEDDGRVLLPSDRHSRLDLVGSLLASVVSEPALGDSPSLCRLWALDQRAASASPLGAHEYPDGGYTAWRSDNLLAVFDHGSLGFGSIAAHGHADALSIVLFAGSVPIVLDPGMPSYQDDPAARDRFRGTPYHSTVGFGESQSEMLGPFIWGARAAVRRADGGWECEWHTGERHWRSVGFETGRLTITDRTSVPGEIVFVLHPRATVAIEGASAVVTIDGVSARFSVEGASAWRAEPGEYSRRPTWSEPTTRLCASMDATEAVTRIEVG